MYSENRPKVSAAATKALGERIVAFLRSRHPVKTATNVAADTHLPISTVAKWLEGAATPSLYAGIRLADAYGPGILCAALEHPPKWLDDAARAEQLEIAERHLAEALAARDALRSRP